MIERFKTFFNLIIDPKLLTNKCIFFMQKVTVNLVFYVLRFTFLEGFLSLSDFVIQTLGRCLTREPISCKCCISTPPPPPTPLSSPGNFRK